MDKGPAGVNENGGEIVEKNKWSSVGGGGGGGKE